jgi:serine O-acetyltransferase
MKIDNVLKRLKKMLRRMLGMDYGDFNEMRRKAMKKGFLGKLALIRYEQHLFRGGGNISLKAEFEGDVIFPHGCFGVFISQLAHIGKECVIFQHVTIGSNTLPDAKQSGGPTIGDNCYIGAGAKIIGGIKIGNNVRIGAGCVVTSDIPDSATVVCQKPRVILHELPRNNKFIAAHLLSTAANRIELDKRQCKG